MQVIDETWHTTAMEGWAIISPFFEIVIITIVINYMLSLFWNSRSMDVMVGLAVFALLFAISFLLYLPVLHKLMLNISNVAAIALLVVFQPELRVALSKFSIRNRRKTGRTEFGNFLDQFATSIYKLAEIGVGAIVALEKNDSLQEFTSNSVVIGADFSSELFESIFTTNAPLHDGAVVIRDGKITHASAILPLAEKGPQVSRMGTRHRAALGASRLTDAVIVVVSEESNEVSVARDGVMIKGVKEDRMKGIIRSVFVNAKTSILQTKG